LRTKGRIGELVERALGASAGNLDQPDFPQLGIELKTIPMDELGRVRESTFVSTIDLQALPNTEWASSRVRRKLARVLWVPVQAAGELALGQRQIGRAHLWEMTDEEEALLKADWQQLAGRIAVGGIEEISAHLGEALQIRPKAANASVQVEVHGPEGEFLKTGPRGFYLRARFTESLLWRLSDESG
jgi:DNA mismatch repair protein MutH